jgi:hypothetical protein
MKWNETERNIAGTSAEFKKNIKMLESSTGFQKKLTDATSIPKKLTTKDFDTEAIVIQSLTRDFLDVPDTSLEVRSYLVDTTIPIVVMALDNLLREAEKRGLVEGDIKTDVDRPKFDAINWLGIIRTSLISRAISLQKQPEILNHQAHKRSSVFLSSWNPSSHFSAKIAQFRFRDK